MIYTIGHSVMDKDAFVDLIEPIEVLVDIRSHPGARTPHFTKEYLEQWITSIGKQYVWEPGLGGWRSNHMGMADHFASKGVDIEVYSRQKFPMQRIAARTNTKHAEPYWTVQGLYDYQWFMTLPEFFDASKRIIEMGKSKNIGYMCCETLWWKCHRSMVSDFMFYAGVDTYHLQPKLTMHRNAISNRIARYHPEVIKIWNEQLASIV